MICQHCGRDVPEGQICPCQSGKVICAVNPVVAGVKRIFRSGLFLVICILSTLAAFCQVAGNVWQDLTDTAAVSGVVLSSPVALLLPVAFWLMFGTCRSNRNPMASTGGVSVLKAWAILTLVGICCLTAVLPLALFILAVAAYLPANVQLPKEFFEFRDQFNQQFFKFLYRFRVTEGVFRMTMIALAVMIVLVLVVLLIYAIKLVSGVSTIRNNFQGQLTKRSFPLFVVVIFFMIGGGQLITAPFFIAFAGGVSALQTLLTGGIYLLLGILGCKYRRMLAGVRRQMEAEPQEFAPAAEVPAAPTAIPTLIEPEQTGSAVPDPQPAEPPRPPKQIGNCPVCNYPLLEYDVCCNRCGEPVPTPAEAPAEDPQE